MAFFHYSKIPARLRDSNAWNNIGVSFSHFEMPAKSTSAFRRAEELGETLAMSNLGFALLHDGFIEEASELANKAIQLGNYHANITDLLKRLKEIPEDEDKKETEALEKVKPKATFYRRFGNAALMETPAEIGDKWRGPETEFNASLEGSNVRIVGSFEADDNPFAAFVDGVVRRKVTRRIEYTLKLRGNVLIGEVKRTTDGQQSSSFLALGSNSRKVRMYFDADRRVLYGMESPSNFYSLERVD